MSTLLPWKDGGRLTGLPKLDCRIEREIRQTALLTFRRTASPEPFGTIFASVTGEMEPDGKGGERERWIVRIAYGAYSTKGKQLRLEASTFEDGIELAELIAHGVLRRDRFLPLLDAPAAPARPTRRPRGRLSTGTRS